MQRNGFPLFAFLLFLTIFSWTKLGDAKTQSDFQSWQNILAIGNFHSNNQFISHLKYWLEAQERLGNKSRRSTQTLLKPGLGYAIKPNLSLWLGYAWVLTAQPLSPISFEENRVWQQLLWAKETKILTFLSRSRLEQRFIERRPKVAYRIRQLFKLSVPFKAFPKLSFINSDEFFWHQNNYLGKNGKGFDQNRYFIGLGYKLRSNTALEIGYLNQYFRRVGAPNYYVNIATVSLFFDFE